MASSSGEIGEDAGDRAREFSHGIRATGGMEKSQEMSATGATDPYFIAANENPTMALVSPVLTEGNYHSWARGMMRSLLSKNKYDFVDGTERMPAKMNPKFKKWERCNVLVMSWITHSVSPDIARSILWIDTAEEAWKDLRERFSQGNTVKISDLADEIMKTEQGDSSVTEYYTKLKILRDELIQYRPLSECKCDPKCRCDVMTKIKKYQEENFVIKFLRGLKPEFNNVVPQILLMEPMPSSTKTFSLVVQQERRNSIPASMSNVTESSAFFSRGASLGTSKNP